MHPDEYPEESCLLPAVAALRWQEIKGPLNVGQKFTFLGCHCGKSVSSTFFLVFFVPSTAARAIPLCFFFRARRRDPVLGVLWQRSLPRMSSTINWRNSSLLFSLILYGFFMESSEQPRHFVPVFFWFQWYGCLVLLFLNKVVLLLGWDHWEFLPPKKWIWGD